MNTYTQTHTFAFCFTWNNQKNYIARYKYLSVALILHYWWKNTNIYPVLYLYKMTHVREKMLEYEVYNIIVLGDDLLYK